MNLQPGEYMWVLLGVGNYDLWNGSFRLVVDNQFMVAESNEGNNQYLQIGPLRQPDLSPAPSRSLPTTPFVITG